MNEFLQWIKQLIGNDTFQGVLAIVSSSAFIALLGVLKSLFGNKRVNGLIETAKGNADKSIAAINKLQEDLVKLNEIIENIQKQVNTTQDITLTYVLNSKATASTKNEVIKLAGGAEQKAAIIEKAIEPAPVVIEEEAKPETLSSLADKL